MAISEDWEEGSWPKKCGQPLEARKGEGPPERNAAPDYTLILAL